MCPIRAPTKKVRTTMIKIGKTIINPAEISAIYPSEGTDG